MASRLEYLIDVLKSEQGLTELEIPEKVEEQEVLYRALQNVRYPAPMTADFLYQQDRYLQEKLVEKGVVDLKDLTPILPNLYLWLLVWRLMPLSMRPTVSFEVVLYLIIRVLTMPFTQLQGLNCVYLS